MANLGTFNASEYEDLFTLVDVGLYKAVISASEVRQSKTSGQNMLELTFSIMGGKFNGAKMKQTFCLFHQDQRVRDIAKRYFASVVRACGKTTIQDSAQIHNIPLLIQIDAQDYTDKEGSIREGRTITRYDSIKSAQAFAPAETPQAQRVHAPQADSGAAPPFMQAQAQAEEQNTTCPF